MGQDTLSSKSKFASFRETAKGWLEKMHLIEAAEDDEPEQNTIPLRRTNIPKRDERVERPASPVRRNQAAPGRNTGRAVQQTHNRSRQSGLPEKKVDTAVFFVDSLLSCTQAIKSIIDGTSVIVHFVDTDRATSQRIIDTLSGAAFALDAKIKKVEDNTYLIAPRGMNINVVRPSERRY